MVKRYFNHKLNCTAYELFAGEYFAVAEPDAFLITLLGSCVAVCLIDEVSGVSGMNHFMLPGKYVENKPAHITDSKYGIFAIDMLIDAMKDLGAQRNNLKAKVFGAGKMVDHFSLDIAKSNAEFIKKYLAAEKIPIIAEDLGGKCARKLYFYNRTKDVFLKRITDFSEEI